MIDRHVWIVSPPGYEHVRAFDDVAAALSDAFNQLGCLAPVVREAPRDWRGAPPIVLGAHLLPAGYELPEGSLVWNFEQLDRKSPWFQGSYMELLERHAVFDYSHRNTAALHEAGMRHVRTLTPGWAPCLERPPSTRERDIDVLFIGSSCPRRTALMVGLQKAGLKTHYGFSVYGAQRDALIDRAKVVLNMHYYESAVFEIARVAPVLANAGCVVTEGSVDDPDMADLAAGMMVKRYEELHDACVLAVGNADLRAYYGEIGRKLFRRRPQVDLIAAMEEGE